MSPRTKKQFEEIREERRAQIMDTALEHFAREGFHATTINHIARHAGISKGLMYNYFESKEALLYEIVRKSADEAYRDFDIDGDGSLSAGEFEMFVRRLAWLMKEKRTFWQLLFQLLMQNEVREEFMKMFVDSGTGLRNNPENQLIQGVMRMISGYFERKRERMESGYDPYIEMNMFIISIKGFAITSVFGPDQDKDMYDKIIERIIDQYK